MYQVLSAGGWVMPFIVLCSIIALAICIERQFALNRKKIAPPHLLATVWQQLRGEGLDAQRLKSLRQGSPLGAILAAGLANRHQGRDVMRESMGSGIACDPPTRALPEYVGYGAAVTPLMGLLGTVLGMISVFTEITTHGTGNAGALAGGISEALITTAAGLAVAIPSLVMHRHYTSRIESIVVDLEREAIKLVDAIHSNQKTEYDL